MNVVGRLVSFLLFCCFPLGAVAEPSDKPAEVGVGIVCDTALQVERFVALSTGGKAPEAAVELVNLEANNRQACGAVAIAFVPGKIVRTIAVTGGTMRVTEVTIVGTVTE